MRTFSARFPFDSVGAVTALMILGLALSGCQALSDSSRSLASALSVSASLKSSSAIFGGGGADEAYRQDVRSATVALTESGASGEDLLRQVGQVAERHGVTDWEAHEATYRAVGEGLRLGGADAPGARAIAREMTGNDAPAYRAVIEGYGS
jgi:hypothetical protein